MTVYGGQSVIVMVENLGRELEENTLEVHYVVISVEISLCNPVPDILVEMEGVCVCVFVYLWTAPLKQRQK